MLARNKNGSLRFCCDYRKLNSRTVADRHPLLKIQNILESLSGNNYLTILDQGKAYHQLYLKPESRHLTAFITPWGFYEWVRVPFGLMNAPAVFQRFMEQYFQDYRDQFVVPYLDDLLVFPKNFDDHLKDLELTFQRLQKYGGKLKTRKCQLFQHEVRHLGRIVSTEGYRLDPKNIEEVRSMLKQKPKNLGDVRRMLGMVGYFRKYIPNFSVKAEPLYQLLKKTNNNYSSSVVAVRLVYNIT